MSKLTVNDVTKLKPDELKKWVQFNLSIESELSEDFNWLGLAEALAFDSRKKTNINEKIQLAELAISIYEWLDNHKNSDHSDSFVNSAISLRVYLLSNGYVGLSQPFFGEKELSKQICKEFSLSPSEALEICQNIKDKINSGINNVLTADVEKLKKLRRIKSKIYFVKNLPVDSKLLEEFKSQGWLDIYEKIP